MAFHLPCFSHSYSASIRHHRPTSLSLSISPFRPSSQSALLPNRHPATLRTPPIANLNNPQHLPDQQTTFPISTTAPSNTSHQHQQPHQSECTNDSIAPALDTGAGAGGNSSIDAGGGFSGGSSSSGDSGNESGDDFGNSLPDDVRAALAYGSIKRDDVVRYLNALRNPLSRLLLSIPAFRSRFMMDSAFLFKLAVQEVIGNGTALAGELAVRGRDVIHELEYVASDLIVGTVIEAAFVWLLAPTMPLPAIPSASKLSRYLATLPAHIFQPSTNLLTFTTTQRIVSFFYTGLQYAAVGFVGGVVGTVITYGLLEGRRRLQKGYEPMKPQPAVVPNAAGWAAFMALSCNTRFQALEGVELAVGRMLGGRGEMSRLMNPAIVVLRFLNNYWGGMQFVHFFRALGLQPTGEEHGVEKVVEKKVDKKVVTEWGTVAVDGVGVGMSRMGAS